MECLCKALTSVALHASHCHEPLESLRTEPATRCLRGEVLRQELDLACDLHTSQRNEGIRLAQIPFVFGNFVLEDAVVPKRIPRQLRHHTVVLMLVVTMVAENQVRFHGLQRLEEILHLRGFVGKVALPERPDDDLRLTGVRQKVRGAATSLPFAHACCSEYHPVDGRVWMFGKEPEYRSTTTDLDIVTVSTEAQ